MAALMEWFSGSSSLVGVFQISLDLVLILCLAFFILTRTKAQQSQLSTDSLAESLGTVIHETEAIGEAFDKNLQERQAIIQQLIHKLDQRLEDGRELCRKMEEMEKEFRTIAATHQISPETENREILRMASKGLKAAAIAKRLGKPIGEIELILKLQRISAL